ncbi:hypothetical protein F3J20_07360 [Paraburkholderia sp. Cy-641]|uniref:hypothetical protein n=1 Tax=Paraburkholderia sp. Cy-641 TaxID=2608337 RepID=UPI00141DAFE2|nr:hypothetical protein [Paraburkholderia sp. Cy-641]NIF77217.1 hypothetical protein [Paraburkholderia sp. Cy-641]
MPEIRTSSSRFSDSSAAASVLSSGHDNDVQDARRTTTPSVQPRGSQDDRFSHLPARSTSRKNSARSQNPAQDTAQNSGDATNSGPSSNPSLATANRPRGSLPLSGRERSSTEAATPAATGASAGTAPEIELRNMSTGQLARLGHEEAQTMLSNLDDLSRTLTDSLRDIGKMHGRVKAALNKADRPVPHDTQIRHLEEVQHWISMMQLQKQGLDHLRDHLTQSLGSGKADTAKSRSWTEWLKSTPVQKAIAAAEVAIAMGFKFGAWYGVEAILPGKASAFETTAKTALLVTQRILLSLTLAGVGEYIPGTDGPRRWAKAGGDIKTIQGFGQAIDQLITLAGQFGTNAASGQAAPSFGQIAGFGLVGLGGVLQTGALNKPVLGAIGHLRGGNDKAGQPIEFVNTDELRAAQSQQAPAGALPIEASDIDLEDGRGLVTQGGRGNTDVNTLINDLWTSQVPAMQAHIVRAFDSMSGVHRALTAPAGSAQDIAEAAAMETSRAMLQSVSPHDHEAQMEKFKQDLDSIRKAATDVSNSLPKNDGLRAQIETVFQDATKMAEAVTKASKNLTTHETAFLRGMTSLGATGLLLSFIGPPTGNQWLSNVNNRAAIAGLTSSIGQNLANLGQFLGGAKPEDGRLMRVLKIGLDSENDNPVLQFAKDWGRNTRFLPIEFVPLTISTTLAEMGSKLKGQIPEAPLRATPSVTTDRLMMEALRMALSNAFMVFRLGHKLEWHHYAAMASTFAGAATALGTEARG